MKINIKYLDVIYRMFEQLRSFINYVRCSFRCCNQREPESVPETPKSYLETNQSHSAFFQDINAQKSAETKSIKINRPSVQSVAIINEGTPILNKKVKPTVQ